MNWGGMMRLSWQVLPFRSLSLLALFLAACRPASTSAGLPEFDSTESGTAGSDSVTPTTVFGPRQPTASRVAGRYTRADLVHIFDYDAGQPLDIQEVSVSDEGSDVRLHDISYAGAAGVRVSAFLVVPAGDGPFAGVLFMHWGGGSKYSFLTEATALAGQGVISILIQAPFERDRDHFVETVINIRRGVDLLTSRPEIDAGRLGYVGHSWGATFGGILADVDRRFRTYILMAGVPSFSEFWGMSDMIPLDGIHYIGQARPATLFFQFASQDESVSRELAMTYFEAASEPKRIQWYDTNHRFGDGAAQQDRIEWLCQELDLP